MCLDRFCLLLRVLQLFIISLRVSLGRVSKNKTTLVYQSPISSCIVTPQ